MKVYDELTVKSINELIIPKQLQAIAHIISCLAHNQCDELIKSEIFELVNHSANNFTFISYILKILSKAFPKNGSSYSKLYESIKSNCKCYDFDPREVDYKESDENEEEDEYEEDDEYDEIKYLITWDKLDDFIIKLENESIDINQEVEDNGEISLIDIACKYGSDKCFSYLNLKGAIISDKTFIYAIEGGCRNIILSLYNSYCLEITDKHMVTALKYHHNDIFDWLLETKGSIDELNVAECFCYGNITGLLFLIENGLDINNISIIQLLFIIPMLCTSITFVYHNYSKSII